VRQRGVVTVEDTPRSGEGESSSNNRQFSFEYIYIRWFDPKARSGTGRRRWEANISNRGPIQS